MDGQTQESMVLPSNTAQPLDVDAERDLLPLTGAALDAKKAADDEAEDEPAADTATAPNAGATEAQTEADSDEDQAEPMKATARVIERPVSTAIKAIDGSDGWRVGGYGVVFNWRDASAQKEFFSKTTDFMWNEFPITMPRPALFDHGQDGTIKYVGVGVVDKIEIDDFGVWVEAQLNRRNRYAQMVKQLLDKGALGWSSGSVQHLAKRSRTTKGHIDVWPIVEFSLTPTPAMPEGTEIGSLKAVWTAADAGFAFKSLGLTTPAALETLTQDAPDDGNQDIADGRHATATKTATIRVRPTPPPPSPIVAIKRNPTMTQEVTVTEIANGVAAALAPAFAQLAESFKALQPPPAAPPAAKGLPLAAAGDNPSAATKSKQRIELGEDRRWADLSSSDLAFMTEAMGAVASGAQLQRFLGGRGEQSKLQKTALNFMKRFDDADRQFERLICAKAIREAGRNEIPGKVIENLPYKSLDAVAANDYDDSALQAAIKYAQESDTATKANELDNVGQSSYGAEWVPTLWGSDLWRRVRIANPVAQNMNRFELPSGTFNWPLESTDPTIYFVPEGTDVTQLVFTAANTITLSKVGSDKRQFVAKKQGGRIAWSRELDEESIIPILPAYRAQLERAIYNAIDNTLINGDTVTSANTNVNLIDGTPTTGTSYLALDGLRKYSIVTNTGTKLDFSGAAPTVALFRALRNKLSRAHLADIPNLVYVVPPEVYMKMLNMPEFSNWLNLGMPGSSVTGLLPYGDPQQVGDTARPLGVIDGIPVYQSAELGLANATGNISGTPSNNTLGAAILYHRTRWWLGYRRNVTIQLLGNDVSGILSDTMQLWGTVRYDAKNFDTASAANGYNISVA